MTEIVKMAATTKATDAEPIPMEISPLIHFLYSLTFTMTQMIAIEKDNRFLSSLFMCF